MATFTKNYSLIKPGLQDYYDVADFNDNMDTIDTALAETERISQKIGNPTDMGANTVFGKLNSGSSTIKSAQRVTYTLPKGSAGAALPIKKVNPTKCIVILERLYDERTPPTKIDYTLNETSLVVSHFTFSVTDMPTIIFGFQIIEFN